MNTLDDYLHHFKSPVPGDKKQHHYLYAIVRDDLKMPAGKLSAQAGHAYTDTLIYAQAHYPDKFACYRNGRLGGSKVTMKAKNTQALIKAYELAVSRQIPAQLIVDHRHVLPPHFDGSPIITALGLGPCTQDESRFITKRFRCV